MATIEAELALDVRASHAEGPNWDAETAVLWWVDILGERVHRFDPASHADTSWATRGQPGGVVLQADGVPIVAGPEGLMALEVSTGSLEMLVPIEPTKPENRSNDAKVDPRGHLWVGTMAYDKRPQNAALHRLVGATSHETVSGLTISNGPAFDERSGRMYLADTALGIVDVFDYAPGTGEVARRRPFLDFSDRGWWPDGMTVDDDGNLWLALGRSGAAHCYAADASLVATVEIPTSHPTSVAFGGGDGGDLYITSSWFDLPEPDRARQPLAGAIFHCRPGVSGPPGPRWRRHAEDD